MAGLVARLLANVNASMQRAGDRQREAARLLVQTLAARGPAPASPRGSAIAPAAAANAARLGAAAPPRPAPAPAPSRGETLSRAAAEANLVTGLFATPQSLAAALIAAEILAPPVALRDR